MNIQLITNDKKRFLSLLLLADEQESMIDRYLERGELFVMRSMQEAEVIAVAVVTNEGNGVFELKNLAVTPACQRKGYGRQMVEYLCRHYADVCHTLLVGTGESKQRYGFTKVAASPTRILPPTSSPSTTTTRLWRTEKS